MLISADIKLMTAWHRRAGTIKQLHDDHTRQGKHVSDTVELLEAIDRDALLRRASAQELTSMLEQAMASSHSSRSPGERGHEPIHAPQISQTPGHANDESGQDEGDEPRHPPAPDYGKSLTRR